MQATIHKLVDTTMIFFVAGAVVIAAAAAPASASSDPSIRKAHRAGVSAQPFQHRFNLHLPRIVNANRKVTRKFDGHVTTVIDEQINYLQMWRNRLNLGESPGCNPKVQNSKIRSRWRGQTMAARYVGVAVIVSTWPACGNVDQVNARTFNINLTNGRSLYLDKLIDHQSAYPVVRRYVNNGTRVVNGDTCDGRMWRKSSLYNWVLKPRGIQFWFDKYEVSAGYCGAVSITVPWRDLPLRTQGQRVATQVRDS